MCGGLAKSLVLLLKKTQGMRPLELGSAGAESAAKSERYVSLIILVRSPVKLINTGEII
jgi:hypothetical protein